VRLDEIGELRRLLMSRRSSGPWSVVELAPCHVAACMTLPEARFEGSLDRGAHTHRNLVASMAFQSHQLTLFSFASFILPDASLLYSGLLWQ